MSKFTISKIRYFVKKTSKTQLEIIISLLDGFGKAVVMTVETFVCIIRGNISIKSTIKQMVEVGWRSTPIILLTSFFTGMVLALQIGTATTNIFNEPIYVGTITGFSLVIEFGPLLTAIVVTGRIGAAITAELGSMKITEQLDALYTLGTNPIEFLAVSRFLACFFMIPILTVIANIIGVYGGMILAVNIWNIPSALYFEQFLEFMSVYTFLHGFIKSFFFALIIVIISCYKGFNTEDGAEGVGKATTNSVMYSLMYILISDYFLTYLLVSLEIK
jgi:phospholipid/cholesterol/gamma-HCH transport system permease protein